MSNKVALQRISKFYLAFGILLIIVSFFILLVSLKPAIWYTLNDNATIDEAVSITKVATASEVTEPETPTEPVEDDLPPFDPSLPAENKLIISSIGVNGIIHEDPDSHSGLEKGMWIVPDFGTPDENELSIIIAAHRFGYVSWTTEFRTTSSFYNLPKTKVGERVQIIWGQRAYEYEVYKTEESSQITDYNADLILYTCKIFNSPVRIFRYLSRVK